VKMKIGRDARMDVERVKAARDAIGNDVELFVDANGAYGRKQALAQAELLQQFDVGWFEEPVSSDDLEGLRFICDHAPSQMQIAAGEYGYHIDYFQRMLEAGAVDVLQADATRCSGFIVFFCKRPRFVKHTTFPCRRIARPPCICTSHVPHQRSCTPNTSMITSVLSTCCLTACPNRLTAQSRRT
jgi:hypothetical protein